MVEKVSDLTSLDVAEFSRLGDNYSESELQQFLNTAINFASSYTGLPIRSTVDGEESLDSHPDIVEAIQVLCSDMYDNRSLLTDTMNINPMVKCILDLHRRNLL